MATIFVFTPPQPPADKIWVYPRGAAVPTKLGQVQWIVGGKGQGPTRNLWSPPDRISGATIGRVACLVHWQLIMTEPPLKLRGLCSKLCFLYGSRMIAQHTHTQTHTQTHTHTHTHTNTNTNTHTSTLARSRQHTYQERTMEFNSVSLCGQVKIAATAGTS